MKPSSIDGFTCGKVRELSDAFVDNELLLAVQSLIFRHIRACGQCAVFIMQKLKVKDLVRKSVKDLAAPASMRQRVRKQTGI
jgi:hypothetical protein